MFLLGKQKYNVSALEGIFKVTRVHNLLYIAVTQYLVAIFLASVPGEWVKTMLDANLFFIVLSTSSIAAAGYFINDYYDIKIDYINRPEEVVVGKYFNRRKALAAHTFLNFFGILIGFLVGWKIALINFFCAFLLWLYSNHLKRLPLIGNLTIALLTSISLLVIALYYQSNEELIYMYALFAFSISLIREILKDIEDVKGDSNFYLKTLPIIWGIRKTKMFIYIISAFFIIGYIYFIYLLSHAVITTYFLLLIIPVGYFFYKLYYADKKSEFSFLADFCKVIMFSGVLSMIFF